MEWLEKHRSNLAALLVVLVTVAGFVLLQVPRRPALQVLAPSIPAAPPTIKVHVTGAVASPGVYQLPADARLEDALKAAGGPVGAEDGVPMNLAAPLRDGQQVVVPQAGALPPPASQSSSTASQSRPAKINLNRASRSELEALPGIGPVTAQKILDHRDRNGGFASVEELKIAKLVTASTFEKLADLVEVR